jgi:hypothetical protein
MVSTAPSTEGGAIARLRIHRRHGARADSQRTGLLREVSLVGLGYFLYSLVRNATTGAEQSAYLHAAQITQWEKVLGLTPEHAINDLVGRNAWLGTLTGYYYATLHFIVTVVVLVWLYRRHPHHYRTLRTGLVLTSLLGLACFRLWPLAPPRLADPGYNDVLVTSHIWGSFSTARVASASDQYAAMPSLHTAWALWCGLALALCARRWWVRLLGVLYPVATVLVILGTANHYFVDIAGGVAVLVAGLSLAPTVVRAAAWMRAETLGVTTVLRTRRTMARETAGERALSMANESRAGDLRGRRVTARVDSATSQKRGPLAR